MNIPALTTASDSALSVLEKYLWQSSDKIGDWFEQQWQAYCAPFYCSVDLRNAGFKLAPVDTNLFPAGFNNLNPKFIPLCVTALKQRLAQINPYPKKLLLLPENHSRNHFYLQHVASLSNIMSQAGLEVRSGQISYGDITEQGEQELHQIRREQNRLLLNDFDPDLIVLNNDLSKGIPSILQGIEQPVFPSLQAGWTIRRKSDHFHYYHKVSSAFAKTIGFDPWLIDCYFSHIDQLNFENREGEQRLADAVADMLNNIQTKYQTLKINAQPFVIVKANAGTYGMGIMSVTSPQQVLGLSRKQRNKMAVIKDGLANTEVIIQEGVFTIETIAKACVEPVIYMLGHHVVGGFYRAHQQRSHEQNLNARGAYFIPLDFAAHHQKTAAAIPNRFYVYGVIALLANLAAAMELATIPKDATITCASPQEN